MDLKRNVRVVILNNGDIMQNGVTKLTGESDYSIYMKNVNLGRNGIITGRYLGVASDSIIDGQCQELFYDGSKFTTNTNTVRIAKMVAVRNTKEGKEVIAIQR